MRPIVAGQQVLFNPGPVNLDPEIKQHLFDIELCHRQEAFEQVLAHVHEQLFLAAELSSADYSLGLLHGSGSLAVDAALASFVRGRVLVLDNGVYCARLATTAAALGCDVVQLPLGLGAVVDLEAAAAALDRERPSWLLVVHHETTTGLLNPLAGLVALARERGVRVLVDAVSSLGVHSVDVAADVICFNSGKCLEALPGVAGVFHRHGLTAHPTVPVLDVPAHTDALPSTPNVAAFLSLGIVLDLHSTPSRRERYARLAQHVWRAGELAGLTPLHPPEHRSHVLTAFSLPDRNADELAARALTKGYVVYHGQGPLRGSVLRVANMGAAMTEDVISDLFAVLGR
jgi:2-aminoethylphosphonate-pyruvate transaminase